MNRYTVEMSAARRRRSGAGEVVLRRATAEAWFVSNRCDPGSEGGTPPPCLGMARSRWGRASDVRTIAAGLLLACLLLLLAVKPAQAQPPSCDGIITQLDGALAPGVCQAIGLGNACLAAPSVNVNPRTLRFTAAGNQAALRNIRQMNTVPQKGAALLLGGTAAKPVKVLVFGDTATAPNGARPASVFTVRAANGQPVCDRTRSGMILQTPQGQNGAIVVNGVTINLGSTAYIVPGADLLFDQDPRIDRRSGSRNPNAPLCSGFDSDCDFGDDRCSRSDRLVWGPFCREDAYPYIADGLYRVTLYGEGEVQAGATDYGVSRSYDSMGAQRLSLPGSYTFCWDGLEAGGTGFETVVQARSDGAYVDHITLEYLGRNCDLPDADNAAGGMDRGEMGVLTVYNIEGDVGVDLPDGQSGDPGAGQRMRVYYNSRGEPVDMDAFPTDAPYVARGSDLAQWATEEDSLPAIEVVGGETKPAAPVVSVEAAALYDGDSPYALRIEARAYDPAAGTKDGDGIDYVHFTVEGPSGAVVYEADDDEAPYCAFGGDSPCEAYLYDLGEDLSEGGVYRVTAAAYTRSGRLATAVASYTLKMPEPTLVPTLVPTEAPPAGDTRPPFFNSVAYPSEYCFGDTLEVSAEVYDDTGVTDVRFHYLVLNVDPEFPEYGGYPYETVDLGSGKSSYTAQFAVGDLNSASFYFTATDAAGNEGQTDTISLVGRDCGPVVK